MKKAFITGVTGQDGGYLAELLLSKNYAVHGLVRRSSSPQLGRIEKYLKHENFHLHYGDLSDANNLAQLVTTIQPDEIYNLGAMSHVQISFESPTYTADVDGLGTLRLLEAIKTAGLVKKTRFYQASTSELYGLVQEVPQSETTPFYPRSPYAVAKLYAYWMTVNYREAYGLYACNGILFNHESPFRGENFVTRKITLGLAALKLGQLDVLELGNLEARRDWGYAPEYVEGMWKMLQAETPDDFVLATGETHTVREFIDEACKVANIKLEWRGMRGSAEEHAVDAVSKKVLVRVDPKYYRPTEVELLIGNATKAQEKLGWKPKVKFSHLVQIMMEADLMKAQKDLKKTFASQ